MKRGILLLLWLLSAALIGLNFWRYPVGSGRDEIYHLQLIDFYTREWQLTRLPQDWDDSSTQAHQPPLYHLTMAAVVDLFLPELGRLDSFQLNPYMVYVPDRYDPTIPRYNRVVYVNHDPSAPYMTTIRVLQGLSILINLLGIFFVWRTVLTLSRATALQHGVKEWLFPVTLAFLAVTPTFWRRAMGVNNDQLIFLFAAVVIWLLAKTLRDGMRWWESIAIGVFLGLGLLTKIYMFPLVITTAVVLIWRGKKALPHLLVIGLITVLISGWWYVRNYRLYGDFTAAAISAEKLNTSRPDPITIPEVIEILMEWPGESWLEYDVILPITRPALWLA
ncbi:MAG: glycosyltransferase family 39 protein, partial [Anaerolineae bacterium]|nr:glycosyltransferase family 39 protein [Anaerolineae bacterium]